MSNLTVVGTITRTELALAVLSLENPGTYRIVSAGPGALSWRREEATSPYVHGSTLVGAVKDVERAPLVIRVEGSSASQLESRTLTLLQAFEQFSYNLTLTIDGVTHTWECQPADYSIGDGGTFDKYHMGMIKNLVAFDIPRNPIPVAGAF